jgi:hypothetical protein
MKSDGVDAWLKHWLKMQKKGSRPLVLKASSDKPSEALANTDQTIVDRRKGKKATAGYVEPDEDNEANTITDDVLGLSLPQSPHSVAPISKSRRTFLASLSNDKHYKNLLLLLFAAKVSNSLSESASTDRWIGW